MTWPLLPVTLVVVVFSVIQTFSDFQLIYVLTGGGPANSTHLIATYAYQIGVGSGLLGEGAALSLFMFPVLFAVVWCSCAAQAHGEHAPVRWLIRAQVEEVGLLLPADGGVHPVHAVPVLLDGDHRLRPDEELYATWRQPNARRRGRCSPRSST